MPKAPYSKMDITGYPLFQLHARPKGMAGNIEHGDVIVEMVRQRGTMDIPTLTELWNVCLKDHPPAKVGDMFRWVQYAIDNRLPIHIDSQVRVALDK